MSEHPDAPRIEQSNDISGIILQATGVEQGHFIVLHDRFAIADALWEAGYRKVDLTALRDLIAEHERREKHNAEVPLNRLSDLQPEPTAAEYRAALGSDLS